jgi:MFS family permease
LTVDVGRTERGIVAVAVLAMFAFSLQQTVVNPTLPALQREFATTTTWSTWIVTAFIFVGAVTTPLIGRLADVFGRKPMLQATIAVFCVGSLVAAIAPNVWVLIACRGVCGVSGAFLALSLALLTQHLRPERVGSAVAVVAASLAAGNIVGVTLAPYVADIASWRWMFGLVAVFAGLALIASIRALPIGHVRIHTGIDLVGAALLAVTIGTLMLALTEANSWGWASPWIVLLFAGSAIGAGAWVALELRLDEPMIDLRVLSHPALAMTLAATFFAGFAVFTWWTLIPRLVAVPRGEPPAVARLVHYGFGADSTQAGFFMLPAMVVSLMTAASIGVVAARVGSRVLLAGVLSLLTLGLVGIALWHDRPWQIYTMMGVIGFCGPISSIAAKLVADHAPRGDHGLVTGLTMVGYYIGGVFGAQIAAAILAAHTIPGTTVPTENAYRVCFFLCAGGALLAIPCALLARTSAGARDSRRLRFAPFRS